MNLLGLLAMAALLAPAPRTILDGVHVVDVATGEILRDRRVVFEGSRIAEVVERTAGIPENAERIDG